MEIEIGTRLFWALIVITFIICAERVFASLKTMQITLTDRIEAGLRKIGWRKK